jgi:hypothetical protein
LVLSSFEKEGKVDCKFILPKLTLTLHVWTLRYLTHGLHCLKFPSQIIINYLLETCMCGANTCIQCVHEAICVCGFFFFLVKTTRSFVYKVWLLMRCFLKAKTLFSN